MARFKIVKQVKTDGGWNVVAFNRNPKGRIIGYLDDLQRKMYTLRGLQFDRRRTRRPHALNLGKSLPRRTLGTHDQRNLLETDQQTPNCRASQKRRPVLTEQEQSAGAQIQTRVTPVGW